MSRAATARAISNLHVVTLPDGQVVISSKPLLHNANGATVNSLTTKPVKEIDPNSIFFLMKFLICCDKDQSLITFKSSNKKIDVYPIWINIFQFLFGREIGDVYSDNSSASKLAQFSACIAHPSLLFATDDVVRAALCGDEDLARRMIALNPNYLLQRGNATDFSGRTYQNLTPFQAALITGDVTMAEIMKSYFDRLPNGQAEMQRQFAEIFPNGIEVNEAAQKQKSETIFVPMLDELIEAIKNASDKDLEAALNNQCDNLRLYLVLNKFRAAFTDLSHGEKIFNPHYLLAAFGAYLYKFDWNLRDWNKLDFFWRQVMGDVQRFLPATYAQAVAYGLEDIVEKMHSCPRSFNFRHDSGFSFYPLSGSFSGLGFNFSGLGFKCSVSFSCCGPIGLHHYNLRMRWFSDFTSNKKIRLAELIKSNKNNKPSELITPRAQSTPSCIIQ